MLASEGQTLQSLRTDALRFRRESFENFDRLIEGQLKNVRLLMQAYDSVRFSLQVNEKMLPRPCNSSYKSSSHVKICASRLIANRVNTLKSMGLRSIEGKLASSENS